MEHKVGIYKQKKAGYSKNAPYNPSFIFDEYPFKGDMTVDKENGVYSSLRELLKLMGLDSDNFGSADWNPFGSFISPGQSVLIKPNFMRHFSGRSGGVSALITHGSLIRAAADYAYIALKGKGRIIIADGPMDDGDFEKIIKLTGVYKIAEYYRKNADFKIEIYDLRQETVIRKDNGIVEKIALKGDPAGYTKVDLGLDSEFKKGGIDYRSLSGPDLKPEILRLHHNESKNEYLISNTLLNADVVLNLPKVKTHKRAGVTLALKNIIGITGDRNWLPHYSIPHCRVSTGNIKGVPFGFKKAVIGLLKKCFGGIVIPVIDNLRQLAGVTASCINKGDWHGNDVIWRTILDLSRIVSYADKKGNLTDKIQRKVFVIADGIIAGEGEGPVSPRPKPCGILAAGFNDIAVDMSITRIMGFDPLKIPKFKNITENSLGKFCDFDFKKINCVSNIKDWDKPLEAIKGRCMAFRPHYGWKCIIINK
jgi:uncharacterized protein (DUF362 family)